MSLTMSNLPRVIAVLSSALLLGGLAAAPAGAAGAAGGSATPGAVGTVGTTQARFGGRSFGRSRGFAPQRRYAPSRRYPARRSPFRGLGGSILKALGIAYLFHALFGLGVGGGSPFGLLLLLGLMFVVVSMFRRRRRYSGAYRY
jgi:uncharacterized membrane protein